MIKAFSKSIKSQLKTNQRFFKFLVVGSTAFLINSIGLEVFYHLGFAPFWATAISAELAIIWNFSIHNIWTFSSKKFTTMKKIFIKFLQFNTTSAGAILIESIVVGIGTFFFGDEWRQLFLILSILIFVVPYNYLMYSRVIWKIHK